MKYISTRGGSPKLNFSEVLLGVLLLTVDYTFLSITLILQTDELNDMRDMSYQDLAFNIFEKFIDDIPSNDLKRDC